MNKVVIASVRKSAEKTSAIIGISAALNKKIAYLKPFGARMVYQENRLWDYDTALVSDIFGLREDPGDMSLGSEHSKLRYVYDEEGTKQKFNWVRNRSLSALIKNRNRASYQGI